MSFESKSVQVAPAYEQSTIETYEMFGWELSSTQELNVKDSHLERGVFGGINSVTESMNYVKLFFKRDKDMPDYKKICELEDEWWYCTQICDENNVGVIPSSWLVRIPLISLSLYGVMLLFGGGGGTLIGFFLLAVVAGILAINYFFNYKPKTEKSTGAYERRCEIEKEIKEYIS